MNPIEVVNRALFLQINAGNDTPAWVVRGAIVIANDVVYLIPLLLLALWFSGEPTRRAQAIHACAVVVLALGINQLIGLVWTHPRPFMIGLGHTWTYHATDSSFPSDHVTVMASIGLALWCDRALRLGAAVLAAGAVVAWARIFVGVHFPLDMLGAVAVAATACVVSAPLWRISGAVFTRGAVRVYHKVLAFPIAFGWLRP